MIENYVTGASGFLGKALTARLNSFTAIPHHELPLWPIKPFETFYFLSTYGNMAGHNNLAETFHANVTDLTMLLQRILSNEIDCLNFVYVSSSSVSLPFQTPYSRTKLAAEQILAAATYIPSIFVRPYSITGVGEQPGHLIPTLIRSCFEGTEMNFVPSAVHDFVDVQDVVDGMLMLVKKMADGVFEIGTGQSTTNEAVANIVQTVCGRKANLKIVGQLRKYDTQDWYCKSSRMRDLGWRPRKTLEQSVTEMVMAYRSEHA